jgi:hypothetical protein
MHLKTSNRPDVMDDARKYNDLENELHSWFQFQTLLLFHYNNHPASTSEISQCRTKMTIDTSSAPCPKALLSDDRIYTEFIDTIEDVIEDSINYM